MTAPSDDNAALAQPPEARAATGDEAGQAAHAAWMAWRMSGGYPDHAFRGSWVADTARYFGERWGCLACNQSEGRHHDDMVPWADLPEEKRAKYRAMGEAGAAVERGRALSVAMRYHAAVETMLNHMGADSEDGAHDEPSDDERDEYYQAREALGALAKEQGA